MHLRSPLSDSLRAGRSVYRIPLGAIFSAPVQTSPGAPPTSYTMDAGLSPRSKAVGAWRLLCLHFIHVI